MHDGVGVAESPCRAQGARQWTRDVCGRTLRTTGMPKPVCQLAGDSKFGYSRNVVQARNAPATKCITSHPAAAISRLITPDLDYRGHTIRHVWAGAEAAPPVRN